MRHGRFGYILLALLVLTGLAGTVSDSTLSRKERLNAVNLLKTTAEQEVDIREYLASSNFSIATKKATETYLEQIQAFEDQCWRDLRKEMERVSPAAKRRQARITDYEIAVAINRNRARITLPEKGNLSGKELTESKWFSQKPNTRLIRYVRNSTEDLRHHIIQTPIGSLDGYQYILYVNESKRIFLQQADSLLAAAAPIP